MNLYKCKLHIDKGVLVYMMFACKKYVSKAITFLAQHTFEFAKSGVN